MRKIFDQLVSDSTTVVHSVMFSNCLRSNWFTETPLLHTGHKGSSDSSDVFDQSGSGSDSLIEVASENASGAHTPEGTVLCFSNISLCGRIIGHFCGGL